MFFRARLCPLWPQLWLLLAHACKAQFMTAVATACDLIRALGSRLFLFFYPCPCAQVATRAKPMGTRVLGVRFALYCFTLPHCSPPFPPLFFFFLLLLCAQVATRARAMGMRVLGVRRSPTPAEAAAGDGVAEAILPFSALRSVLAQCDYALAALPLTPETKGLLGAAEFAAAKPGCIFMNVGEG